MPLVLTQDQTVSVIQLEGEIAIGTASELKGAFVEALSSGKDVRVDPSRVTDVDITALQLLWAAERKAAASGIRFVLAHPWPEHVATIAANAGWTRLPGIQEITTSQ